MLEFLMKRPLNLKSLILILSLFTISRQLTAANCLYAADNIVAVVNNEIITQKDLNDFFNFMRVQYSRELQGKALEVKLQEARQDLLQRLIEDRLILQEAKNSKMVIDESRVRDKVSELRKRYQTQADFERDLAKQGLVPADLENKIREQFLMFNIVEYKVRSKIVIGPEEITDYYNKNKKQFIKPDERQLQVITLDDENMAKALDYDLRLGKKIEDLAGRYDFRFNLLSASAGDELRKEIQDVVFKMGIGEVSGPIKIDEQYYIFRLDHIVASRQLSLAEAQTKVQAYLFEKKMQEEMNRWIDELKSRAYIKIIAS